MVLRNLKGTSQYILHSYISTKVGIPYAYKVEECSGQYIDSCFFFFLGLEYHSHLETAIEVMKKIRNFTY